MLTVDTMSKMYAITYRRFGMPKIETTYARARSQEAAEQAAARMADGRPGYEIVAVTEAADQEQAYALYAAAVPAAA